MIDTVIFDIGNVLIPWEPKWLFRHYLADDHEIDRFLEEVDFHAWNAEQDAGRPFDEAVALQGARFPQYRHLLEAYAQRWEETLGPPIEGSVDLIRLCKREGYRVLALTNWSNETFPRACELYPFLTEFEGIVVSGCERIIKPQREIYAVLCQRYGVVPDKAVFLDDSPRNVEAARAFGLRAVHFTGVADALSDLRRLGLRL